MDGDGRKGETLGPRPSEIPGLMPRHRVCFPVSGFFLVSIFQEWFSNFAKSVATIHFGRRGFLMFGGNQRGDSSKATFNMLSGTGCNLLLHRVTLLPRDSNTTVPLLLSSKPYVG